MGSRMAGIALSAKPFCLSCIGGRYHQDCPYRSAVGRRRLIGKSALKTFQYLADELNANGGLNGKRVEWVGFDNKLDPQISLVQAQKAADQGFRIVTQGAGSSVAAALSDWVTKYNDRNPGKQIIYLNFGAVDPALTNDKCSYWHFRFDANSDIKMSALTNFMKDAWRARRFLSPLGGKPPDARHFALAVNSAHLRSQDQFHIHLGCLAPVVRRWLPRVAANLPTGTWTRLDFVMTGSSFGALRTGRGDLAGVEPLRLAAQELADKTQSMSRLTLLVAQVRPEDDGELVILASAANVSGSLGRTSAENLLDLACTNGSELPGGI